MMNTQEHNIQCACVRWFALQYPQFRGLLFAVPNGGARSKATAGMLKAEGVTAGVADLLLLIPTPDCHGLCIEMKTPTGRQSAEQKAWQQAVERQGYKYALCRSFTDFAATVKAHINKNSTK